MKLHEVEALKPGILQTGVQARFDVIGREAIIESEFAAARPLAILRRHLGRRVEFLIWIGAHDLAEQAFAVAFAVSQSRVEEVAAKINRALEGAERFFIIRACPLGHAPHAVTDFADRPAGAAKAPIVHGSILRSCLSTSVAPSINLSSPGW